MSRYAFEELLKLWATEQITAEQAIGQILLQLQTVLKRLAELEQRKV